MTLLRTGVKSSGVVHLTTTSYAILGLLSLRPHSAYELTNQARRSLRFIWQRQWVVRHLVAEVDLGQYERTAHV